MSKVTDRQRRVYDLREKGKTYRLIGESLGVTTNRARQIYLRAKARIENPGPGLSTRAANLLVYWDLWLFGERQPDREAVREFIESKGDAIFKYRYVGPAVVRELCEWSNAELPDRLKRKRCPYCGKVTGRQPDIVPQAMAAGEVGISSQAVADRLARGTLKGYSVYGRIWVSISELKKKGCRWG